MHVKLFVNFFKTYTMKQPNTSTFVKDLGFTKFTINIIKEARFVKPTSTLQSGNSNFSHYVIKLKICHY